MTEGHCASVLIIQPSRNTGAICSSQYAGLVIVCEYLDSEDTKGKLCIARVLECFARFLYTLISL